jgi:F420-dependent oxidoreductase-like protein
MVEPQVGGSYEDLLELARWADATGLTAFARSDHYLNGDMSAPATDALTSIGGLARETSNIKLTVLMTPLTFRHPAVIAKTAATLDEMSGGRFELGVGTGWMESEHTQFGMELPDMRTRFSLLYETLAFIRTAFGREETDTYRGRHFQLDVTDVLPRPTGKLPIVIGGGGPKKTPRLAGRFADEYNMFMTDAASLASRLGHMRQSATEAGRDPDEIRISMVSQVIGGTDEAAYQERLGSLAAQRGIEPAELEANFLGRGMFCGTHERLAERAAEVAALGVGRLYVQQFAPLGDIDTSPITADIAAIRRS